MKKLSILAIVSFIILISCSKSAIIGQNETQPRGPSLMESVQETLIPVANGSVIENYPNWGGAGANAWCAADTNGYGVNNLYLYNTAATCLDLYTTANSIPAGATITSVMVYAYACTNANKGAGPGSLKLAIKENGITTLGTQYALPVSNVFSLYAETWTVRPSDGQPFTKADIDAIEFGFSQTRGAGVSFTKTGHVRCVVNYN